MSLTSFPSVYAAFAHQARATPDRPFLNVVPSTAEVYGILPGEIDYATALKDVDAKAMAFAAAGYVKGMRVAVLLENRPSYFLTWLALNKLGLSVVPINPDLRAAELAHLLSHADPALVIAIPARVSDLRQAANVPVIEEGAQLPPPGHRAVAETSVGNDQEAAVLYTSGTTGKPKGCVLSNAYFQMAGDWYRGLGGIVSLRDTGERMITPLPVFHMNAMAASFMGMLSVGGCLTVLDRFHPHRWWDDVAAARATCLHYLGVMPSILMALPTTPADRAHQVRFSFGAGIDPKLHAPFEVRFGFPLCEGWAMTETGLAVHLTNNTSDRRVGASCLGKPTPEVEVKIAPEPSGDAGELLVRRAGPNPRKGFFSHYYKDPAATKAAWAGGWFNTGDLVRQDAEGRMYFVDRKKNVIRRSGENIAAVEVEGVLMKHPKVLAAGVAAVPDTLRGDEVFACLQVAARSTQLANEIADWALGQMAYYKVPAYIAFVDALPLTPTQKIQRQALKDLCRALLDKPATVRLSHLKKRQAMA